MRIVLQRVTKASVTVHSEIVGAIEHGLLLLVGVGVGELPRGNARNGRPRRRDADLFRRMWKIQTFSA